MLGDGDRGPLWDEQWIRHSQNWGDEFDGGATNSWEGSKKFHRNLWKKARGKKRLQVD
eukprot:CAMPEP_0174308700 /NCGR_PEP_ID=MMETSP0810-20121108/1925_1 /TAXON_ID=73025 ORGANISM="Eutreptiella gymnastica-like, Strain CCMP1594" /NCGR_SAMPLE_ID=MMETSP0810 /ASSEMBLY_ACC=CAM_ASM_000659 /LENGTH=57 /DNA_ID=CAMNT_0015416101 /DNA_START=1159 /DNA_END=1332 /DNA_ORIENTATION=-